MKIYKGYRLLMAAALCFLLAGCSSQSTADSTASTENGALTQQAADNTPAEQRQADLAGEVTDIVGNEIALKIIEMPEMPQNGGDKAAPPDGAQNNGNGNPPADLQNMSEEERQALREQRQSGDGSRPTGTRPQMELTYTGESRSIIIPAGVPISSGFGRQDSEIELSDIQKGTVLMVWFSDGDTSDSATVESVRIMQQAGSN